MAAGRGDGHRGPGTAVEALAEARLKQPLRHHRRPDEAQGSFWETLIGSAFGLLGAAMYLWQKLRPRPAPIPRQRVVHGGGRRLRRTDRRGGQLGAHQGLWLSLQQCCNDGVLLPMGQREVRAESEAPGSPGARPKLKPGTFTLITVSR